MKLAQMKPARMKPALTKLTRLFHVLAVVVVAFLSLTGVSRASESAVYIIFDGSGSMWAQLGDGTHKVTAARDVLHEFVGQDFGGKELALRAYGHRRKGDCDDTELVVSFAPASGAADSIREFADRVNPKGKTPISRSLRAALDDMGDRTGEIILISDGIETCDEDPCELVRSWRDKNISIKVHVVGLGLKEEERSAMECIAEVAGTTYRDAQSADQLAEGLEAIRDESPGGDDPIETDWQVLEIRASNESGKKMRVVGTASREGFEPIAVGSNGRQRVPAGPWEVTVGVRTRNGGIYRPVTQTVDVAAGELTEASFVVEEPPSVSARFVQLGEEQRGAFVRGYQDGNEVLGFRASDRAYVDPGTYEFRAVPNADNQLSVTESFEPGDHKEILFEMVQTVRAKLMMVSSESGIRFRANLELWQDGELRYKVHSNNGADVLPGTYDVKLPLNLTPYVHEGLVITTEEKQSHQIEVPVGHLTVKYQNADGSPIQDGRFFIERVTDATYKSDGVKRSGERLPLTAGSYVVEGWKKLGNFDPVTIDIEVGEELDLILKPKD